MTCRRLLDRARNLYNLRFVHSFVRVWPACSERRFFTSFFRTTATLQSFMCKLCAEPHNALAFCCNRLCRLSSSVNLLKSLEFIQLLRQRDGTLTRPRYTNFGQLQPFRCRQGRLRDCEHQRKSDMRQIFDESLKASRVQTREHGAARPVQERSARCGSNGTRQRRLHRALPRRYRGEQALLRRQWSDSSGPCPPIKIA